MAQAIGNATADYPDRYRGFHPSSGAKLYLLPQGEKVRLLRGKDSHSSSWIPRSSRGMTALARGMTADTFFVSLRAPRFLWGAAIQNLAWIASSQKTLLAMTAANPPYSGVSTNRK